MELYIINKFGVSVIVAKELIAAFDFCARSGLLNQSIDEFCMSMLDMARHCNTLSIININRVLSQFLGIGFFMLNKWYLNTILVMFKKCTFRF